QADNAAPAARPALSSSRRLKRTTVCRAGYCVPMGNPPSLRLALQPQRSGAIAVVEAVVGGRVLHIRLPGGRDRGGVQVHIVLLLRHIALNVEDELLPCLQFLGAPLL